MKLLIVFLIGLAFIALNLAMSGQTPPESLENATAAEVAALFFGVIGKGPVQSLLHAVVMWTLTYGAIFYLGFQKSQTIRLLSLMFFGSIYVLNWYADNVGFRFYDSNTAEGFIIKEYLVAVLITSYFAAIDGTLSRSDTAENPHLSAFSAFYISIPTLITFGLTFVLQQYVWEHDGATYAQESLAFLAGVTSGVLFLSNLLFAFIAWPRYFPCIKIGLEPASQRTMEQST